MLKRAGLGLCHGDRCCVPQGQIHGILVERLIFVIKHLGGDGHVVAHLGGFRHVQFDVLRHRRRFLHGHRHRSRGHIAHGCGGSQLSRLLRGEFLGKYALIISDTVEGFPADGDGGVCPGNRVAVRVMGRGGVGDFLPRHNRARLGPQGDAAYLDDMHLGQLHRFAWGAAEQVIAFFLVVVFHVGKGGKHGLGCGNTALPITGQGGAGQDWLQVTGLGGGEGEVEAREVHGVVFRPGPARQATGLQLANLVRGVGARGYVVGVGVTANPHHIPVQLRIIPGDTHVCCAFRGVDEEPTLGQILE